MDSENSNPEYHKEGLEEFKDDQKKKIETIVLIGEIKNLTTKLVDALSNFLEKDDSDKSVKINCYTRSILKLLEIFYCFELTDFMGDQYFEIQNNLDEILQQINEIRAKFGLDGVIFPMR